MCAAVQTDRLIDTWVMQISRREIYLFGSPLYRRRLQLIENTGLHAHRILCIASVHQRCRGKRRFSLGSEISSRKPLCDGLSMNSLDFGGNHSGGAQPPDQAPVDCIS